MLNGLINKMLEIFEKLDRKALSLTLMYLLYQIYFIINHSYLNKIYSSKVHKI